MENSSKNVKNPVCDRRKKIALTAIQLNENFLHNLQQANALAHMTMLESSSDDDEIEGAAIKYIRETLGTTEKV